MGNELLKRCIEVVCVDDFIPSIDHDQEIEVARSYYVRTVAASDVVGMGMLGFSILHYSRLTCRFGWAHLFFRPSFPFSSSS